MKFIGMNTGRPAPSKQELKTLCRERRLPFRPVWSCLMNGRPVLLNSRYAAPGRIYRAFRIAPDDWDRTPELRAFHPRPMSFY